MQVGTIRWYNIIPNYITKELQVLKYTVMQQSSLN